MRVLIILAIVVVLLAFAGWLSFSYGPGRTSVNLETQEIREDTEEVVRTGARILDNAGDDLESARDNAEPAERDAQRPTADRK